MLHVVTSNQAVALASRLAEVLAEPPADPFEPEWIAVPSEGMRRWLALELARRLGASSPAGADGIAANITNAFPGSLRARVLAADRPDGDPDPWELERLSWAVLAVLDRSGDDPLLASLAEVAPGASIYSRSRRLADLFDRYHLHRPAMVRAWAKGNDVDGSGRSLASPTDGEGYRWQPHLWRLVRAQLDAPSPPERLPGLLHRVRSGDLDLQLPSRLTLFGLSVLPGGTGFVELATAVAVDRDLHLFLLDPSPVTSELIARNSAPTGPEEVRLRAGDRSAELVDHPLLRSWGRLPRETAMVVADARAHGFPEPERLGRDATELAAPATVLAQLQADLVAGRAPSERSDLDVGDGSVQLHAAHGASRQAEVLRDAILHLLAEDHTLTEDDIVVLCPALDRFAPFVEAAFGPSSEQASAPPGTSPSLRYRVADRSVAAANPMVTGLEALLDLAVGRFDAPAVLDFIAQPAVRSRYGFSTEDLARFDDWVGELNIRWGIDRAHRDDHGVGAAVAANTWRAGLDRLLLGAAVADDELGVSLGEVVPFGIEADDVELGGRLADLFDHLGRLATAARASRPVLEWLKLMDEVIEAVLAPVDRDPLQRDSLSRALGEIADHATGPDGAATNLLSFVDLRRLIGERFTGRRGRADFFRGGISVTSPDTLRSIPFRVVALLGMDQTAFGATAVSNDDLMATAAWVGDGDPRAGARQAILDAVLAARDHLIVIREGRDLRTNQEVPPAVVVAELAEAVVASTAGSNLASAVPRLEHVHPRQPFDDRAFTPGAIVSGRSWSFDRTALAGAVARQGRGRGRGRGHQDAPFLLEPLAGAVSPEADHQVIDLADLRQFLAHPIQWFLERRLQIVVPRANEAHPTRLPVDVVMLDRWRVGDRLLTTVLDGGEPDRWEHLEHRLGTLPPGVLGTEKAAELREQVELIAGAARVLGLRSGPPTPLPVDVTLPDGTRVVGRVDGRLGTIGPGPAAVGFGRAKPKHRLAAWLDVVALTATDPSEAWRAATVFRDEKKVDAAEVAMAGPEADRQARAVEALAVAVDWFRRGQAEPLPYFPKLSPLLHEGTANPSAWSGSFFPEQRDRFVALVFGQLTYDELLDLPAAMGDPGHGPGRIRRLANHLWSTVESSVTDRLDEEAAS